MTSLETPIEVHDLTVSYHYKPVLWDIDCVFLEGQTTAIVGPNGAGKSTLMKAILGLLPLASGYVKVYGESIEEKRSLVAYVPQRGEVDWDFPINVFDVVLMGRYGRLPFYRRVRSEDREVTEEALEQVGMSKYRDRQISQLSGGQQQRVFIARALAQKASIYLMDEPFAGVDAAPENAILALFDQLTAEGKTVICVHHDLHTVADYFQNTMLLNLRLVAMGPTARVFTNENLDKTYGGRLGLLTDITERLRKSELGAREG